MKHIDLFAGIGGFSLAAHRTGWETVAWVEKNPFCQKVLAKNFPNAQGYGDIKEVNFKQWHGKVQILTGGFPCQPFSLAGKRKGATDDRYLWDEMLRAVREIKPAFIVGENVAGLTSMEYAQPFAKWLPLGMAAKTHFGRKYHRHLYRKRQFFILNEIIKDLEQEGYTVETYIIPACAVQAWHRRDRIWIVAYLDESTTRQNGYSDRTSRDQSTAVQATKQERNASEFFGQGRDHLLFKVGTSPNSDQIRRSKLELQRKQTIGAMFGGFSENGEIVNGERRIEPIIRRNVHGLSARMDRRLNNATKRKEVLGNAIVPQVAQEIFKAIEITFKIETWRT